MLQNSTNLIVSTYNPKNSVFGRILAYSALKIDFLKNHFRFCFVNIVVVKMYQALIQNLE